MKKERIEYDYFCDICGQEKSSIIGYKRESAMIGSPVCEDAFIVEQSRKVDEHICPNCLNKFLFLAQQVSSHKTIKYKVEMK